MLPFMVATNLLNDALALPPNQRLALVQQLWESLLADPEHLPLTDEQGKELCRRYDDFLTNPHDQYSWGQVAKFIKQRLQAK